MNAAPMAVIALKLKSIHVSREASRRNESSTRYRGSSESMALLFNRTIVCGSFVPPSPSGWGSTEPVADEDLDTVR